MSWGFLTSLIFCSLALGMPPNPAPNPKSDPNAPPTPSPSSGPFNDGFVASPEPATPKTHSSGGSPIPTVMPQPQAPVPHHNLGPLPPPAKLLYQFEQPSGAAENPKNRHPLFLTRAETTHRSPRGDASDGAPTALDDKILALTTALHETQMDSARVGHEYDSDVLMIQTHKDLLLMLQDQKKKGEERGISRVVSPEELDAAQVDLTRSEWKARESKAKKAEYDAESEVLKLKISKSRGTPISLTQMAQAYADLWKTRVDKAIAAERQARVEYRFLNRIRDMNNRLHKGQAISDKEMVSTESEADQGEVIWKLAQTLQEQTEKAYQQALEDVKTAQALDAAEKAKQEPKPDPKKD